MSPSAATELRGAPRYWEIVWGQLRKRTRSMIAFYVILGMFLVAWFAPLVAGSTPLVMRTADGVRAPGLSGLFTAEFALDRFFNGGLVVIPFTAAGMLVWRLASRRARNMRFSDVVVRWAAVQALAWLAAGLVLVLVRPFNDTADYVGMAASAPPSDWYVFPLMPRSAHAISGEVLAGPGPGRILGTDHVGRDVLARMIHGTRVALSVGFVAEVIAVSIGTVVGALAGFFGGWTDFAISRFIEVMICFPSFFLVLILTVTFGQKIFLVMLVIGITGWTGVARLMRGEFLRLRRQDFVTAVRALGAGNGRIIFRHVLPNAMGPVLVSATFGVAGAILTESGLSFLGLGDVNLPSWGETLAEGRQFLEQAWWLIVFPGLAIFGTVVAFNLVGEGLRDAMDPRLRE